MSLRDQSRNEYKRAMKSLSCARSALNSAMFRRVADIVDRIVSLAPDQDNAHASVSGDTVYIFVNLTSIDGLKDPRLENILAMLDGENHYNVATFDYPTMMNRDYTYRYVAGEGVLIVKVSAYFKEDSETCKRVIVGYTQPKEPEPIYKLTCNGDAGEVVNV